MEQSELSVAKRYLALADTFANRPVLARRGTLPSVVKFLVHNNREVQFTAAQTLCLLAEHPENPEVICKQQGLVITLFEVYKQCRGNDPELHGVITQIFTLLKSALGGEVGSLLAGEESGVMTGDKENDSHSTIGGKKVPTLRTVPQFMDPGQSIRTVKNRPTRIHKHSHEVKYRTVVLDVHNVSEEEDSQELEELLLTTRGVVSYTIERTGGEEETEGVVRISLYLSTPTLALRKVLLDQGFDHELITEKEVAGMAGGVGNGEYKKAATSAAGEDFRESLVLHGTESNSLSDRLRQQKEDRDNKTTGERSSIVGFLGKLTASFW